MKIIDKIHEVATMLDETNKKAVEVLKDISILPDEWPPKAYKHLTLEDSKNKTFTVDKDTQKWFFPDGVPAEAFVTVGEYKYIPLDYARKHGFPTLRINTHRLQGDINVLMAESEDKLVRTLSTAVGSLPVELARDSEVIKVGKKIYVSDIKVDTEIKGNMLNIGFAVLVAAEATDEYIADAISHEFKTRMMTIQQNMMITLQNNEGNKMIKGEGRKPILKWEFTADDAELAVEALRAANPDGAKEAISKPEDMMKMSFQGADVVSVTADETKLSVEFEADKK